MAWKCVLSASSCISAHTCARLYCRAIDDSKRDWATECNIFRAGFRSIPEDAAQSAWDHPRMENGDLRCNHLDAPRPIRDSEFALYGDGGYDIKLGASFSAQVKYFQAVPLYFNHRSILSVRLPLVFLSGTATKKARFIPLNSRR